MQDINKWLDDAPRLTEFSSNSNSPIFQQSDPAGKSSGKLDARKRPATGLKSGAFGPQQVSRPKKVQRTIDRLQPGKSKGNLLKKPLPGGASGDASAHQNSSDNDQSKKESAKDEPKLSLGSVLRNADSIHSICKSLTQSPGATASNEDDEDAAKSPGAAGKSKDNKDGKADPGNSRKSDEAKGASDEELPQPVKMKSATPNLSAWFKAFGAPQQKTSKKKEDDAEEKKDDAPEVSAGGRQRRLSTGGSSACESVSSFSQESSPGIASRSPQAQQPIMSAMETQQIKVGGFVFFDKS